MKCSPPSPILFSNEKSPPEEGGTLLDFGGSLSSQQQTSEVLSPKERCGKFLTVHPDSFYDYDNHVFVEGEEGQVWTRCSNPNCSEHEYKRVVYRCHRRDHDDYAVIEHKHRRDIEILPDTCTNSRYARARFKLEEFFRDYEGVRYAVFTMRPVWLSDSSDLIRWTNQLTKCLSVWVGKQIRGCTIVVDPIKNSDGSYHLHFNVAWVGEYILKSRLEKRWAKFGGGYVKVYRRWGKKGKGFTIHYLALRTAVMNEPDKKQKTDITPEEYSRIFAKVKFLRFRFWSKSERNETSAWIKTWLDFNNHICSICWSEKERKVVKTQSELFVNSSVDYFT